MSLRYSILINGVVVNERIIVGSNVVNNALDAAGACNDATGTCNDATGTYNDAAEEIPSIHIDWVTESNVDTFISFVSDERRIHQL